MFEKPESGISRWNKALPLELPQKILLDPLEILQGLKARPLEIPHYFFLVTLGNSASFLINPWKFHMLFLWYLYHCIVCSPLSAGVGWASNQIFKRGGGGGLIGPQLLEGVARKEGVTFFRGSCSCHIKMN